MPVPRIRKDVWKLPDGDKTLFWYEKAVADLQSRSIGKQTSWWSLGAIHGIDVDLWRDFGFLQPEEDLPFDPTVEGYWNQCQHQSWYFLPWHRGYLSAFETIVRASIKRLGGPDDWALPYWNYSAGGDALELPRAFAKAELDDGSPNHLFVARRYGNAQIPGRQDPIVIDPRAVLIQAAMDQPHYTGTGSGGTTGFGGTKTPFSHFASQDGDFNGFLERQPHNGIHVLVGGGFKGNGLSRDARDLGLMTNPDTAALDPIFWLHHANIDRLWSFWLRKHGAPGTAADAYANPTDPDWLGGPSDIVFTMPQSDTETRQFTPEQMRDTKSPGLDYIYDDETAPEQLPDAVAMRLERLGMAPQAARTMAGELVMAPPKQAELLGSNDQHLRLNADEIETHVQLDNAASGRLKSTLEIATFGASRRAPDRVYLNLENIKSPSDAAAFYVYVNLPSGADPEANPDHFAGMISMFGARKASEPNGPHAGNGISESLDITAIVDRLHLANQLSQPLSIKLISAVPGATDDAVTIGRISVYRQGQ